MPWDGYRIDWIGSTQSFLAMFARFAGCHPLAPRAKKSASLRLDDSKNGCPPARRTLVPVPCVDTVLMLVGSFAVDGVAVRTITERGAFGLDRSQENLPHVVVDAEPPSSRDFRA